MSSTQTEGHTQHPTVDGARAAAATEPTRTLGLHGRPAARRKRRMCDEVRHSPRCSGARGSWAHYRDARSTHNEPRFAAVPAPVAEGSEGFRRRDRRYPSPGTEFRRGVQTQTVTAKRHVAMEAIERSTGRNGTWFKIATKCRCV